MFVHDRRFEIINIIKQSGSVNSKDLVSRFKVSLETIRRDLDYLNSAGIVEKVYGGAVLKNRMSRIENLNERLEENIPLKKELCKKSYELINDGDVIILASGTTALELAKEISSGNKKLTVILNSPDLLEIIKTNDRVDIISLGGRYLDSERAFVGGITVEALATVCANKAFIFPTSINSDFEMCSSFYELVDIDKCIMTSSAKTFVLADSTKFNKSALYKIGQITPAMTVVSDNNLDSETVKRFKEKGLNIL